MNPTEDDVDILRFIGSAIDDDNDPAPENTPEQKYQQQGNGQEGDEVWKLEGILCPSKTNRM